MSSKQERYRIAVLDDYRTSLFHSRTGRWAMTRTIIERLPKLRMIASTGTRNASIDLKPQKTGAFASFIRATPRRRRSNYLALILGSGRHSRRREHVTAWRRMAAVGR